MRCTDYLHQTLERYRREGIVQGDPAYTWNEAHTPTPKCLGGTETVSLIYEDHLIHDLYQAADYDCLTYWTPDVKKFLFGNGYFCDNWFELCDIYDKYTKQRGTQLGKSCVENKVGIFSEDPAYKAKIREIVTNVGLRNVELGRGIFNSDPQRQAEIKAKRFITKSNCSKMIELIGPDGTVYIFDSVWLAAETLGLRRGHLVDICNQRVNSRGHRRYKHKGFTARYLPPDRY